MKLYYSPFSPNARRTLAVAHHLGIELDTQLLNLATGEQRKPEYLAINPNGMVPTLVDGEFVLWESTAIMHYLASKRPNNSLWPNDDRVRMDIVRWQSWGLAHWGPPCGVFTWENLVKKRLNLGEPDPVELKKADEKFHRFATALNGHLARRDHLVGSGLTLADFSVASPLTYAEPAAIPLGNYPHIRRWYSAIAALEAWKKTAPPQG